MIISASRRTDIPAFYSRWFMNRINEGFLYTRNPFNHNQVKKISLQKEDVDAIVFWTRDPKPILKHLDYLTNLGYKYYFQYTITGYNRAFEARTPNPYEAIKTFQELSNKIGKEKVIWRFDPIIFSNLTDSSELIRLFAKIANNLKGYTNKVVVSFYDNYGKAQNNIKKNTDLILLKPTIGELNNLIDAIVCIASQNNMQVETCAEDLQKLQIRNEYLIEGKCIDDKLIDKLFNIDLHLKKDKTQRKECGCVESIDIGTYNTCMHGCVYCYATSSYQNATKNNTQHNDDSPFLLTSPKDEVYINQNRTLF